KRKSSRKSCHIRHRFPYSAAAAYRKTPNLSVRGLNPAHSMASLIKLCELNKCGFLLSSRLYCRYRNSLSESHRFSRINAGRGLYRRLGLSPDPEDPISLTATNITL